MNELRALHDLPRVYLAGPMVFFEDLAQIFNRMKEICATEGLRGVAPVDGQIDLQGVAAGRPLYCKIVNADFALMDDCDGALICLDPFHGVVEMDAGTAVEVGYLHARRKPMSGWTSDTRSFREKILLHSGGVVLDAVANDVGATSGVERDRDGMLVHSAELTQHGMVQMPIEMSGGEVFANGDWEKAFRLAARRLKAILDR
jgi:nucleoside 2-deoxyribosyltransferase|nr:nucleoside 2-deoxyribosyltransferase [Neorhizobium tomejilense]